MVAKKDRPSDGMATLIGLIALALALVAATLPRLRSFEFHGLKVNLSGEAELAQSQGRAAELIKGKAVELSLANSAVDVAASAKQTEEERNPDATVAILAWIASANAELTRKTREKQLQAVARGSDPAEAARLSDDEIAKIVNATQPEVAG